MRRLIVLVLITLTTLILGCAATPQQLEEEKAIKEAYKWPYLIKTCTQEIYFTEEYIIDNQGDLVIKKFLKLTRDTSGYPTLSEKKVIVSKGCFSVEER